MNGQQEPYSGSDDGYDLAFARRDKARRLAGTAFFMSILSLLGAVLVTVILPYLLAPIAIVLAVLSRGGAGKMEKSARRAVLIGWIAILVNTAMIGGNYYILLHDAQAREQANRLMRQLYGYSFDDMLALIEQQYGISLGATGDADAVLEVMQQPEAGAANGEDDGTGFLPDGTPADGQKDTDGAGEGAGEGPDDASEESPANPDSAGAGENPDDSSEGSSADSGGAEAGENPDNATEESPADSDGAWEGEVILDDRNTII